MADKEERITIHQVLYPCKKCSINCNKNDWKNCDFYQNYISGITRQEAIKRIAKALKEKSEQMAIEHLNSDPYNNPCGAEDLAEAALNALLEGK